VTVPAAEHAGTARGVGALTVLFDETIPQESGPLLAWLLALGLDARGVQVELEGPQIVFVVGGARVRAFVGHEPYPLEQLDRRRVGAAFRAGCGAVTLRFGFVPHAYFTRTPDAWYPDGFARAMSRVACALLSRGHAVVVHRAGELVVSAEEFVARLGDLDAPGCVPFSAWIDLRAGDADATLVSRGLRAFGLPEVRVEHPAAPGSWAAARRFEAALFACYRLCRGMWIGDGPFEVPRRIQIGAGVPQLFDPVDVERWDARAEGGELDPRGNVVPMEIVLRHRDDSDDVVARWAAGRLGFGGYEALFVHGLMAWLRFGQLSMTPAFPQPVPHRVIILGGDAAHAIVVSSGIGRVAQPGGEPARGNVHVEVAAFVPRALAGNVEWVEAIVESIASEAHRPDRVARLDPWALFPTNVAPFLLRPWGPVAMGGGPAVTLLELVPLTSAEAQSVRAAPQTAPARFGDYAPDTSAARWAAALAAKP
jgi:hypothetical protein